jgi:IS1 family transposase
VKWHLKKQDKLGLYMYHMLLGASIRRCAQEVGISTLTAFNWRHKLLNAFSEAVPEGFEGIVESDDIFFLHSEKGQCPTDRPSRNSGGTASKRGISDEQVAVVVTCDRSDHKELKVVKRGRITKQDLEDTLKGKLDNAKVLCTDSHRSYTAFAKEKPFKHKKFYASKGQKVTERIYHVQHVNNIASRLRQWMSRFNGVATKYLQNYMNWFMIMERIKTSNERLRLFMSYAYDAANPWQQWKMGLNSDAL